MQPPHPGTSALNPFHSLRSAFLSQVMRCAYSLSAMYVLSSTFLSSTLHPKNSMFHAQDMPGKQLQGIMTPYCEIAKHPCLAPLAKQLSTPVQRPDPTKKLAKMACIIQPLLLCRKLPSKCQDTQ